MSFGHAGDGNMYIYILRDDLTEEGRRMKLDAAFDRMYARAKDWGGQVSGEHGEVFAMRWCLKKALGE